MLKVFMRYSQSIVCYMGQWLQRKSLTSVLVASSAEINLVIFYTVFFSLLVFLVSAFGPFLVYMCMFFIYE